MKHYLLKILIFFSLPLFGQIGGTIGNSDNGFSYSIGGRNGIVGSVVTLTWPEKMLVSYVSINSHSVFTQAQKDTILACLSIQSVRDTFETKYAKTTCNFFMFFENSNKTTALSTRTNSKTGSTLRWRYGYNTYDVWDQNNLPADTCKNGWLFVTSVDGFTGWTVFDINTNTFTLCPAIFWATPTFIYVHGNSLTSFKTYATWTNIQRTYIYLNNLTSVQSYSTWPNMQYYVWRQNTLTGNLPLITANPSVTLYYRMNDNDFTTTTLSVFRKGLLEFNIQNNNLSFTEVNALLVAMDAWYAGANLMTANCTITLNGAGMGAPTDGDLNANIVSLLSKATSQSKTWSFLINY